jgi:sphingolipid delta-4 desaturase
VVTPSAWHRARHAAILATHPELRTLAGPNPWTAACVVAVVAFQLGVAYALRSAAWWVVLAAAFVVGAFAVHALGVLVHECAHNLVFRSTAANKALALLANVPLVLPGAIDFRDKHLSHHRHLGEGREVDFQTPPAEIAAWTGTSRWRKLLWLAFGSFLSAGSLGGEGRRPDPWLRINTLTQIVAVGAFFGLAGPRAIVYLGLSGLFAFGAHPVSLRGYAEHFDQRPEQPTNSYYGRLNLLSFNVGYHVEHHDLPAVPWNRLPEIRRRAAHFYDDLAATRSWTDLGVRLVLQPDVGVGRYAATRSSTVGRISA